MRWFRWLTAAKSSAAAVAQTLTSRLLILALNFSTGVMVARALGPENRGTAAAMSLWPIILCGLTTFGIPTALRYEISRNQIAKGRLFSVALILSSLAGLIAMLVGVLLIPFLLHQYSAQAIRFAMLMMLFAPQIMCSFLLQAYLEVSGSFTRSNRLQYLPPAVTLITLVVLQGTHQLSSFSAPLAYFVPPVFMTAWTIYLVRRSLQFPLDFVQQSRVLLHYGIRAYGLNVLSTLSSQIDQAIIIGFLSAESFGLYAIAINVSMVLSVFATSLNAVLFPKASGLDAESAIAIVSRSARMIFATTLLAYALLVVVLPTLIRSLYGDAYLTDIKLTRIMMLEVVLGSTCNTFAQAFMATGRPGMVSLLQGLGLCATFPLMLFLIPRFGLVGAAYALLLSTTIRLIMMLSLFPIVLRRQFPTLFLNADDIREIRVQVRRALVH